MVGDRGRIPLNGQAAYLRKSADQVLYTGFQLLREGSAETHPRPNFAAVVLIDFWVILCEPCKKEMPGYQVRWTDMVGRVSPSSD